MTQDEKMHSSPENTNCGVDPKLRMR